MLFPPLEKLVDAGFEALSKRDYKKALGLAKRIQKKKNTAAYEIAGRAYWEMGERRKAIEQMRQGAEIAPQVYVFWSYLGHYYSDLGEYDEAIECLTRGMFLRAPTGEFEYNLAVVKGRLGDSEGALMHLEQFNWQASNLSLVGLHEAKAHWLCDLSRSEEAIAVCDETIALLDDDTPDDMRARLHSTKAKALWQLDRDPAEILHEAYEAVRIHKEDAAAAWLLRELSGEKSPSARKCFVLIRGDWHKPVEGKQMCFLTKYALVAENEEQVLDLVKPFEPTVLRDSLAIDDIVWDEEAPDIPMGVYDAQNRYIFFPPDKIKKARQRLKPD